MENSDLQIKNLIKIITTLILLVPLFFGINSEYLAIKYLNFIIILIILIGIICGLILGLLIVKYAFQNEKLERMKSHEVVRGIKNKDVRVLFIWFPLTMVMEELIFRYYITGFLAQIINPDQTIFISALIFGLYHIHIWFGFKNYEIVVSYIGYSFLLGLFLGFIFLNLGIFPCIVIHLFLVLIIYYSIAQKIGT